IRHVQALRVQELEDLIRKSIQPETWAPTGTLGSLNYYEGLLVVVHTAKAHQELADLLAVMRQALAARPTGSAPEAVSSSSQQPVPTDPVAGGSQPAGGRSTLRFASL